LQSVTEQVEEGHNLSSLSNSFYSFSWTDISSLLGVARMMIFSILTDSELANKVSEIKNTHRRKVDYRPVKVNGLQCN